MASLDLDQHHWTGSGSSLDLDHHCWIWIITRSGSLEVIITGSGSSLDLDLRWSSSWVYYLVIGSSTEAALFYAGCRPTPHVGLRPALTSDLLVRKARPALTSDLLIRKAYHLRMINI